MPELATAAEVSQRTLEYIFRKYLNLTPVKYLILKRLHGMHRDLRNFDPGATTVSECSTHWGFTQLGRTAVMYRHLFGLSPSATLNQHYRKTNNSFIDRFRLGYPLMEEGTGALRKPAALNSTGHYNKGEMLAHPG